MAILTLPQPFPPPFEYRLRTAAGTLHPINEIHLWMRRVPGIAETETRLERRYHEIPASVVSRWVRLGIQPPD